MGQKARFTSAAFRRSHGTEPRGAGGWGFQRTTSETAFADELSGDAVFVHGETFAAAKRTLVALHGGGLWAVLP